MRPINCYLTNRDTLTPVKGMVEKLRHCNGVGNITIIDCDSTYQPLLDWYHEIDRKSNSSVSVIREKNIGHLAPWNHLFDIDNEPGHFYFVSDGDFDLSGVPDNFLVRLCETMDEWTWPIKAGLSLRLDDIPNDSLTREQALAAELKFWTDPVDRGTYRANIDTTPAVYRSGHGWIGYGPAIRLAPPYCCRHLPWYLTMENMTEEWVWYHSRLNPHGIVYGPQIKKKLGI